MLIAATGIFLVASYFIQNYTNKEIDLNPMVDEPVVVESVSYDRYAYQHLNDETKVTYDQIYNCMTEYSEKITVSTKDNSTLQKAYEAVMADYGDLFWVNGYKYNTYTSDDKVVSIEFWPKYTMSKDQRDVYKASIEATADEWLSGISQDASDFKKALYVFETLIENVDYNTDSEENQNILSVFLYRSTVCQGYADAAWYLLDKLGIKSTVITGTANGESHAWNLVYLDGAYYYMDVTWGNSKYLDGNNDTAKRVNYAYFAMTTEEISQNHVITVDFEVPECLSNADNFFVHEGLYYDWFGVDSIGNRLAQSYNNGEAEISLKFSNSDLYSKVINYFIDENHLSDYCRGINSVYYLLDENANVLTIQWVKR
ncbi:Transglutaminase-like superfamily protein [Pseudobutyrivibrio sp. 49]|nr:Transglutaminase-like superfamily protein [Pseudobutyrivibrio sp. 49]